MAAATTLMGCLPTYSQIGNSAILLLLMVRMLQGLSVGGQLMSSLVFTLEGKPHGKWGVFGSAVMACTNVGTFLGGVVAYMLRAILKEEQLLSWGWRQPFLSGICISLCGIYLKYFCKHDEIFTGHHAPVPTSETSESDSDGVHTSATVDHLTHANGNQQPSNPLRIAFSAKNRRSLLASSMVPMVWSGGFYLCFVWMAFYMTDLLRPPVPGAFGVNSCSLLLLALCFHLRVHFLTAPVDEL
jgi:MHS family proline/betaine transporter-like MFS transporter